jgi:hypothetical protein
MTVLKGTLSTIRLRSVGWSTVRMPNIGRFRAILGSQQGLSGLLNGSLGLNGTVGRRGVLGSSLAGSSRKFVTTLRLGSMMPLLRGQQGWRIPRVGRREQGPGPPYLRPLYRGENPEIDGGVVLMVPVVRHHLRSGALRLRSGWLPILQTAVAACLAWLLAVLVLGLERPTFAPSAAGARSS